MGSRCRDEKIFLAIKIRYLLIQYTYLFKNILVGLNI